MTQDEKWTRTKHRSFRELVEKVHLVYVHEVQHWLRKHQQEDRLRINEGRLR